MKTMKVIAVGLVLSVIVVGCKKKEEQPVPKTPVQAPIAGPAQMPMSPHGNMETKVERKIVVPDSVRARWKSVKFVFEDKVSKKSSEHIVNIRSEFTIPNSGLKIVTGDFLPDFTMDGSTITSVSDAPNNPAVMVEIFENGKSIFKGWLYSKFPAVHPFEHEKYGITLKEGVKG